MFSHEVQHGLDSDISDFSQYAECPASGITVDSEFWIRAVKSRNTGGGA